MESDAIGADFPVPVQKAADIGAYSAGQIAATRTTQNKHSSKAAKFAFA